jgi:hypothetical protein
LPTPADLKSACPSCPRRKKQAARGVRSRRRAYRRPGRRSSSVITFPPLGSLARRTTDCPTVALRYVRRRATSFSPSVVAARTRAARSSLRLSESCSPSSMARSTRPLKRLSIGAGHMMFVGHFSHCRITSAWEISRGYFLGIALASQPQVSYVVDIYNDTTNDDAPGDYDARVGGPARCRQRRCPTSGALMGAGYRNRSHRSEHGNALVTRTSVQSCRSFQGAVGWEASSPRQDGSRAGARRPPHSRRPWLGRGLLPGSGLACEALGFDRGACSGRPRCASEGRSALESCLENLVEEGGRVGSGRLGNKLIRQEALPAVDVL